MLTLKSKEGGTKQVPVQRSSASRLTDFDTVMQVRSRPCFRPAPAPVRGAPTRARAPQMCDELYKTVAKSGVDAAQVDRLIAELLAMEGRNVEAEA